MLPPPSITALEAFAHREEHTFVDVREPGEQAQGRIAGALSLPLSVLATPQYNPELERNQTYVVYCAAGVRSLKAIEILSAMGFQRLVNMSDGYQGWQSLPRAGMECAS